MHKFTFKRIFDIVMALAIGMLLLPLIAVLSVVIFARDGRPIFYVSERMKSPDKGFKLIKFRSMTTAGDDGKATGTHKNSRITKTGRLLRKSRIDEIPQLWNIFIGDMSFVGPRPPLRRYVEKYPDIYNSVLVARPGVTGMASIFFHKHEEFLLRNAKSAEDSERIYCTLCIPKKAKLDLIYQKNQSLCTDIWLMFITVFRRKR